MLLLKKVRAFTLSELLVVIILTGIVSGIVLSAYNLVGGYYGALEKKSASIVGLDNLNRSLQYDFEFSQEITITESNTILCWGDKGSKRFYSFDNKWLLQKQQTRSDTLTCTVEEWIFKRNGRVVTEGNIDELELKVIIYQQSMTWHFLKNSDAASQLLNNDSSEWVRH